jgi:DNA-binding SARP family transcriptional activator
MALGAKLHPAVKSVSVTAHEPIATAAANWLRDLPTVPAYRMRIDVLGSLRLIRDGVEETGADFRRQRVRQLLAYLIVHRRVRREQAAEDLWPEVTDPGKNLRVTLTHLQRALQPERRQGEVPYFVRTDGAWLVLAGADRLEVDSWQLDLLLDEADDAERDSRPAAALVAYQSTLPLWRGEPFADAPYDDWVVPERARLQARYVAGALRAGELLLAAGSPAEAAAAAERAISADPTAEGAYRLVARSHLARTDAAGARRVLDRCCTALSALGLEPDAETRALLS